MDISKLDGSVQDADEFLRGAAEQEGLTWHEFCEKYGIVDSSKERQIRRHEVPLKNG